MVLSNEFTMIEKENDDSLGKRKLLSSECDDYECTNCEGSDDYDSILIKHLTDECSRLPDCKCSCCTYEKYWTDNNTRKRTKQTHEDEEVSVINETESIQCNDDKIFKCSKRSCKSAFKSKGTLARHLKYECGKSPRFKCSDCSYRSHWSSNVYLHIKLVHKGQLASLVKSTEIEPIRYENTRIHKCPNSSCMRAYKNADTLTHHLLYECNKPPNYKCPYCSYTSRWNCNVHRHVKSVHGDRVVSVINLKKIVSASDTLFECLNVGCTRVCTARQDQMRHMKYECGKSPRYKCPYCAYVSFWKTSVRRHSRIEHNARKITVIDLNPKESTIDDAKRIFPCTNADCERVYRYKGTLNQHLKYECGKTPSFKCSYCSYVSYWDSNVRQHIRTKHNDKTVIVINLNAKETMRNVETKIHKCPNLGCKCAYRYKQNLNRHLTYRCGNALNNKCTCCSSETSAQDDKKSKVIDEDTIEKRMYKCPNAGCKCRYEYRGHLSRHLRNECGVIPCYKCFDLSDSLIDASEICT